MGLFDRLRQWAGLSDSEKVEMDRRAFMKGMSITGAGLLVPGVAVFDLGRGLRAEVPERIRFVDEHGRLKHPGACLEDLQVHRTAPGDLRVYCNGIEMMPGDDYVAVTERGNGFRIQPSRVQTLGEGDILSVQYTARAQRPEGEAPFRVADDGAGLEVIKRNFFLEYDLT
jgi:hypothetical protein